MKFYRLEDIDKLFPFIKDQTKRLIESGKPVEVCCKVITKTRTNQQNKYLFALYEHLLAFHNETGFMIDGLNFKFYTREFLHEYLKARFDVKTTTKLSTTAFTEFVDKIQNEWMLQSEGMYDYFFPYEQLDEYQQHLTGGYNV